MPRILKRLNWEIDEFIDEQTHDEFMIRWEHIKREFSRFPPFQKVKLNGREMYQWQYQYILRDQLQKLVNWASVFDEDVIEEYDFEPEPERQAEQPKAPQIAPQGDEWAQRDEARKIAHIQEAGQRKIEESGKKLAGAIGGEG